MKVEPPLTLHAVNIILQQIKIIAKRSTFGHMAVTSVASNIFERSALKISFLLSPIVLLTLHPSCYILYTYQKDNRQPDWELSSLTLPKPSQIIMIQQLCSCILSYPQWWFVSINPPRDIRRYSHHQRPHLSGSPGILYIQLKLETISVIVQCSILDQGKSHIPSSALALKPRQQRTIRVKLSFSLLMI